MAASLDTLRCFFAVPVPPALQAAIIDLVDTLRVRPGGERVRWVRAENLHVTLRFLGEVDAGLVPSLLAEVRTRVAQQPRFELSLADVGPFPSRRRPSVFALTLEPQAPLAALAETVEAGVVASGLPAEERPFRAHLTLGRLRERSPELSVTASDTGPSDPLPVAEVVLFQSELRRSGARHTALGRLPLGPAGPGCG